MLLPAAASVRMLSLNDSRQTLALFGAAATHAAAGDIATAAAAVHVLLLRMLASYG